MKKTATSLLAYFEHSRFYLVIFLLIFALHVFLRFFELEPRMQFTWDQIQNSWMMKDMIDGGKLPLTGMVAKQNTGFYIGPAYYYLLVPFYWAFQLDPIAAGVFAGVVSVATFMVLFLVTKKLFSLPVALITVFMYAISSASITFDRVPWPVIFIPMISLAIFYFLYRVANGEPKALLPLGLLVGFSFHFHFTSIYYLLILLLSLPLLPRNKQTFGLGLMALLLFAVWFIPNIVAEYGNKVGSTDKLVEYLQTYYHGFHLRRVAQLFHDAFIEYEGVLFFKPIKQLGYLIPLLFAWLLFKQKPERSSRVFIYLMTLWILVPWFVMSLYSGEISNYYFSITRPVVFITLGYIFCYSFSQRKTALTAALIAILVFYTSANVQNFLSIKYVTLPKYRAEVLQAIDEGRTIEFKEGDPKSYLYYLYAERNQKK